MTVLSNKPLNGFANEDDGRLNQFHHRTVPEKMVTSSPREDHPAQSHPKTFPDIKINGQPPDFLLESSRVTQEACTVKPIAIVGMGMRLPGDVNSPKALWDLLVDKRDGRCEVPGDRYNIDAFYSPVKKRGFVSMRHGYFLKNTDLQCVDEAFSISKTEAETMDPQQRLLLEVVWECMETAGQTNWRGKEIGCYVGSFGEDWLEMGSKDSQNVGLYRISGTGDFFLANRVSYEYDFRGPRYFFYDCKNKAIKLMDASMVIKSGCSASMLCLNEAFQALQRGDCSSAIVAGTNLIMSPTMTINMSEQEALSPNGMCRTFDADADGYARGEAVSAIFIKPLEAALQEGDPIRAVIRSVASNCDGRTQGISNPSSEAQEALIRRTYSAAGISELSQTPFVECHGTGTTVGDPLEVRAIANAFGKKGLYIGSVKPNLGHSEGASGLTSIIKSVLALEKGVIPPNINFSKPNPQIPFEEANLKVPLDSIPWPSKRPERISINSFGIGGANAHAILDSAASFTKDTSTEHSLPHTASQLLVISSNRAESLRRSVEQLEKYIVNNPFKIDQLAYTLNCRRTHLPFRAYSVLSQDGTSTFSAPHKIGEIPNICFVFTGQGAQWPGMAKELIESYPSFAQDVGLMDQTLQSLERKPGWSIRDELLKPDHLSRVSQAEFSQPLCTTVQVALVKLLRKFGVHPEAVVGHSSGEIAGAFASGAITESEAVLISYFRGVASQVTKSTGAMAAIGLGRSDVEAFLSEGVVIACENSPQSVTISGDLDMLEAVCSTIKSLQPSVLVQRLHVDKAYHSHHMREVGPIYHSMLRKAICSRYGSIPFYSSVNGQVFGPKRPIEPGYWVENLLSPVLFSPAVQAMVSTFTGKTVLVEIGPHSALAGPIKQICTTHKASCAYEPTLLRGKRCVASILHTIGRLHCQNVNINFEEVTERTATLTDLPLYQWHHERKSWDESRLSRDWRLRKFPHHDLLGSRIVDGNDVEPAWRNMLRLDDVPWIRDHKVKDDIVLPAAAYIAMMGESIRQVQGSPAFEMHRVLIDAALVLAETESVELHTSMRPCRLTDSLDSPWYNFSILSYKGNTWTKHCHGQVRSAPQMHGGPSEHHEYPVQVDTTKWYRVMKKAGLNYGRTFQALSDIAANPAAPLATARARNARQVHESAYQLHPATIDACLQLMTVAMSKGLARNFHQLCVPTEIDELYVSTSVTGIQIHVDTSSRSSVTAYSDEKAVLMLRGLKWKELEDSEAKFLDPYRATKLVWNKDVDFVDVQTLIKPVAPRRHVVELAERLTILSVVEALSRLSNVQTNAQHLKKFRVWLESIKARAERNENNILTDASALASLPTQERQAAIEATVQALEKHGAHAVSTPIQRIVGNVSEIFCDPTRALEVLHEGDILTEMYNYTSSWNCAEFSELLAHARPDMSVLEIGAGTGGTTSAALEQLVSPSGKRRYSSYTYTDISAGFFTSAKQRFSKYEKLIFKKLDISRDPAEQDFEEASYDLILATNVLHATPSLGKTLQNVRKLLKSDGRLFFQDLCPETHWLGLAMGCLSGWWLGEDDDRPTEPYVSPERWRAELEKAGLGRIDAVSYDNDYPSQVNISYVARPTLSRKSLGCVTILCDRDCIKAPVQDMTEFFRSLGIAVDVRKLGQDLPDNQCVISALDLEKPFLRNVAEADFESLKKHLLNLRSGGIVWLTELSQRDCYEPSYSLILGLARSVRPEMSVPFATLECDEFTAKTWENSWKLVQKLENSSGDEDVDPDWEYVQSKGHLLISRLQSVSVPDRLSSISGRSIKRLSIKKFGLLDTLQWTEGDKLSLGDNEVEIETKASGLNFRDLLIAMGIIGWSLIGLGGECSGIVRAVGSKVKHIKVGDRVATLANWTFATRVFAFEEVCVKIPDSLGFEDAATMFAVYCTVVHSLVNLGGIGKGSTVLIHSACGGVGLAALQLCEHYGAEVYATVGNAEKRAHLQSAYGMSPTRIFNSRDDSFLAAVMKETNGKGVDIVLNSLSGELLHASWKCVAEHGRMIELGKRDFIGHGKLEMSIFEANRSFFGVDLAHISVKKPALCQSLLQQCIEYYNTGAIKPIRPIKVFEASEVQECFRYMQRGKHMGKICVRMPDDSTHLPCMAAAPELRFRNDAAYLLVGGFGGIGRSVTTWMVEHGAEHLIILSRSGRESSQNLRQIAILEAMGCLVTAPSGSVTDTAFVADVVRNAEMPIAGVMQMSMVLQDRAFRDMRLEDWNVAVSPKVDGTWALHEATKGVSLDFFVMLSSMSGLLGLSGQANYAAGNTFQDAFANYRRGLGLPASVLDVGMVEDVGWVAENQAVLEQFRNNHTFMIDEAGLLQMLHLSIIESGLSTSRVQALSDPAKGEADVSQMAVALGSTLPLTDPSNRYLWRRDPRLRPFRVRDDYVEQSTDQHSDRGDEDGAICELRQLLTSMADTPAAICEDEADCLRIITKGIAYRLFSFMLQDVEDADPGKNCAVLTQSLTSLGVDSLVAIEIRNWWRRTFDFDISVLELLDTGCIEEMGKLAFKGVKRLHGQDK